MKLLITFIASVFLVGAAAGLPAFAQAPERGETVRDRARPDYDPDGIRLRSFRLFPEMAVNVVYDDNIRAVDKSSPIYLDDVFFLIQPEIRLESDWSRHELNSGAWLRSARYDEYDNQDFDDYSVWLDGGLELGNSRLTGNARASRLHEPPSSPNFRQNAISPTKYTKNDLGLKYRFVPNRFFAQVQLDWSRLNYQPDTVVIFDDADQPIGTRVVYNDDRDRDQTNVRLRTGYKLSPGAGLFVQARYFDFDYKTKVDRNRNNLDQDGYDLVVGSELDLSGVTTGEFYVGYRSIDYADPQFESQDGFLVGAAIDWNITRLTTITFGADQILRGSIVNGINESPPPAEIGSSGIEELVLSVGVDHELRRNIILIMELRDADEDFLNITRKDEVFTARFGVKYTLNRRWVIDAGYIFEQRDSNYKNVPGFNVQTFDINSLYFGVLARI